MVVELIRCISLREEGSKDCNFALFGWCCSHVPVLFFLSIFVLILSPTSSGRLWSSRAHKKGLSGPSTAESNLMLAIKKKKKNHSTVLSLIFIPIISVLTDKEDQVFIGSLDLLLDILPLCNLCLGQGNSLFPKSFFLFSFCLHRVRQTQLIPFLVSLYAVWMYVEQFAWHHWGLGCQVAASLLSKTKHTGWLVELHLDLQIRAKKLDYVRLNNQVLLRALVDSHNNQISSKMHFLTMIFT